MGRWPAFVAIGLGLAGAVTGGYAYLTRAPQIDFDIGAVGYRVDLPAGYCLPEGEEIGAAERTNAADVDNRTVLFLVSCARGARLGPQDYSRIATPKALEYERVPKQMVLERLGGPGWVDLGEAGYNASKALGIDVAVEGAPQALGHDGDCAYQGVVATIRSNAGGRTLTYRQSAGTCFTAIGGQVFAITRYGRGTGREDVARLLREARALSLAIRVKS